MKALMRSALVALLLGLGLASGSGARSFMVGR